MPKEENTRKGVILAAGFGSRLAGVDDETNLKPLTTVHGIPLIYRTIRSLSVAGCQEVIIVLGHGYDEIKEDILASYTGDTPITFAKNEEYNLSNGISVLAASPYVEGEFVLTMADHILSDEMMRLAASHKPPIDGATLLVDHKVDEIFDMDDATKVYSKDNKIQKIGKQITDYNCIDTGVFICTQKLMDAIQVVYDEKGDASLSDGIQTLADRGRMHTLNIGDAFWQDVDTPEMLAHAEKLLQAEED